MYCAEARNDASGNPYGALYLFNNTSEIFTLFAPTIKQRRDPVSEGFLDATVLVGNRYLSAPREMRFSAWRCCPLRSREHSVSCFEWHYSSPFFNGVKVIGPLLKHGCSFIKPLRFVVDTTNAVLNVI